MILAAEEIGRRRRYPLEVLAFDGPEPLDPPLAAGHGEEYLFGDSCARVCAFRHEAIFPRLQARFVRL